MQQTDYTFTDKIVELRMDISHPNNASKVFVLVEGIDDKKVLRKFFNAEHTKIEPIPGGKVKLGEGLATLCEVYPLIIGIRDADFLHLSNNANKISSNLFLTDFHDLELLMVSCDDTFSAVIHEFCDDDKRTHGLLKSKLLKAIHFVACCRWYNELNNVGFKFEGIRFGDILDSSFLEISKQEFIKKVIERSHNATQRDIESIVFNVQQLEKSNFELMQLCNGHDFMKITALYLTSKSEKGVSDVTIAQSFRTAYNLMSFKKTRLYALTNEWAEKKGYKIYN